MKKLIPLVVIGVFVFIVFMGLTSFTRIEAGYKGIKVDLYGNDQDIEVVQGWVFYNPLSSRVYRFPTFVQHKVWTSDLTEDSRRNEEFTVTTKDGLSAQFDIGLDYKVIPTKVMDIFRTYRKPLDEITNEFIRTTVRNAYNGTASNYAAEEMVSKRAKYEAEVKTKLIKDMEVQGFEVTQIAIVGKVRLPATIEAAINAKIQAVQEAMRAENEKQKVIADANKEIEKARGVAQAITIRAEAQSKANDILNKSLTPLLVQKIYIEKWDGKLPTYGQVPQLFNSITSK